MTEIEMIRDVDPHTLLAYKIVERAILDWRLITYGYKSGEKVSEAEIKGFLKSQWCEALLGGTCVNGEWVLKKLEEEKAMARGEIPRPEKKKKPPQKEITIDGRTENVYAWSRYLKVSTTTIYKWYNRKGRQFVEQWLTEVKRERGL